MNPLRSFDETLLAVADVEGWMSPDQARELYRSAAATHTGDQIVEIGSFHGRSTIVLASAAPEGVTVIAIDPHAGNDRGPQEIDGFEIDAEADNAVFTANLEAAGVTHRVRHARAFSDRAHGEVQGDVAVLYIDGAHRFSPARVDIRDWGARVRPGGTMLIHDAFSSVGVTLAIVRELVFGRRFRYGGRARSLVIYHADLDHSPRSRIANIAVQVAQLPWFAKNVTIKAIITAHLDGLVVRLTGRRLEWPY